MPVVFEKEIGKILVINTHGDILQYIVLAGVIIRGIERRLADAQLAVSIIFLFVVTVFITSCVCTIACINCNINSYIKLFVTFFVTSLTHLFSIHKATSRLTSASVISANLSSIAFCTSPNLLSSTL